MEKQIAINYLDLSTSNLLAEFGKGSHTPGSGSAAALSALVAVQLLRTVCILTKGKESYTSVHEQMEFIQEEIENTYFPTLVEIFSKDSEEFAKVSQFRILRDSATDIKLKEKYGREAAEQLRVATDIPITLCNLCFKILDLAISIFDNGYKATRGDAGVAISNLLASISGTIFVIMLNISAGKKSKWTEAKRKIAEELAEKYTKVHREAFARVINLYDEGIPVGQTKLLFN